MPATYVAGVVALATFLASRKLDPQRQLDAAVMAALTVAGLDRLVAHGQHARRRTTTSLCAQCFRRQRSSSSLPPQGYPFGLPAARASPPGRRCAVCCLGFPRRCRSIYGNVDRPACPARPRICANARNVGRGAPPLRAGRTGWQQSAFPGGHDPLARQSVMGAVVEPQLLFCRTRVDARLCAVASPPAGGDQRIVHPRLRG